MKRTDDHDIAVERAARELENGRPILLIADTVELHQPTAVLVCAAASATTSTVAFLVRHSSGYLEVALPSTECARLGLSVMSGADPTGNDATGYTVTVDAAAGIGTGISAADRATTMRLLTDPQSTAASFTRPGHVQPRGTSSAGVRTHRDHAHAAVDLARIAGVSLACGIGHLVSEARPAELADAAEARSFADHHGLVALDIGDIVDWYADREAFVAEGPPFTTHMRHGVFVGTTYYLPGQPVEHVVFTFGTPQTAASTPVYVHDECLGQTFFTDSCECEEGLDRAMSAIVRAGHGVVVYIRRPAAAAGGACPGNAGRTTLEPIHRRLLAQLAIDRIHPVQPTQRTCVALQARTS
ncbi:bifunctional 3,4-dihydroxy-2-butanone-4-phosphate synthase/GTP cyclohydrolase II [Rhodococcus sp. ABRD24]|uniref:3,4-dihydroxy-2-butanone-4-phosphate synthase n=1 Tax=Rhodococcus sp. ABRD24 TaxID=2507582 RepID=UPI001038E757|nr:3,4-dihydroxy-2-butanone-4-phosphate synthase [Rhodococcus sp. ABRD24]QBJ97752.1 bifunctional 3,4-dihydroxy-2-butanone-4-phosphate synthase/GTP cyclohydrolase II [Rhodococcus sp. ABRD24]